MYHFSGGLGSGKTRTLLKTLSLHQNHDTYLSMYLNPNSHSETVQAVKDTGCWGFSNGGQDRQTDAGVYMLTLKAIRLAQDLQKAGKNVLFGVDGYRNLLQA